MCLARIDAPAAFRLTSAARLTNPARRARHGCPPLRVCCILCKQPAALEDQLISAHAAPSSPCSPCARAPATTRMAPPGLPAPCCPSAGRRMLVGRRSAKQTQRPGPEAAAWRLVSASWVLPGSQCKRHRTASLSSRGSTHLRLFPPDEAGQQRAQLVVPARRGRGEACRRGCTQPEAHRGSGGCTQPEAHRGGRGHSWSCLHRWQAVKPGAGCTQATHSGREEQRAQPTMRKLGSKAGAQPALRSEHAAINDWSAGAPSPQLVDTQACPPPFVHWQPSNPAHHSAGYQGTCSPQRALCGS